MKTTTVASNNPMNRSSCPLVLLLIPLALGCFALSPQARGTCQQGCLANENTVLGDDALLNNTGDDNTAIGSQALFSNATGASNTASGSHALLNNTTGNNNTGNGLSALNNNTTGSNNIALGALAGTNLTTGGNNIYIDSRGRSTESGTIRIGTQQGRTFVAGISGVTVAGVSR